MSKIDIILKKISNIENKIDKYFKQESKKFLIPEPQHNPQDVAFKSEYDEKAMIEYIKNNNVAIHCPSEEDYNKFTEMLEKNGETWGSGDKFSKINYYKRYKELTCIVSGYFQNWAYGCIGSSEFGWNVTNKKILTVQELFNKFKIEKKENKLVEDIEYDSRTGRVIKINNYQLLKKLYMISETFFSISHFYLKDRRKEYLNYLIKLGLLYISKETCEKAEQEMIKKVEEENKKIGAKC